WALPAHSRAGRLEKSKRRRSASGCCCRIRSDFPKSVCRFVCECYARGRRRNHNRLTRDEREPFHFKLVSRVEAGPEERHSPNSIGPLEETNAGGVGAEGMGWRIRMAQEKRRQGQRRAAH